MSEVTIDVPRRLDHIDALFKMAIPTTDLSQHQKCIINFSKCTFGEPLPMLLLGCEYRALKRANPHVEFVCRSVDNDFRGYADHIGFFRYMGFLRGNQPGAAFGSQNYIPIQIIDMDELKEASGDRPYAEIVEEKANELAALLLQAEVGETLRLVRYALREVMRNAVEHSFGKRLIIFGQYWPARERAEIVIFDTGVGIKSTLQDAGVIGKVTGFEAIQKSLQPGVSGVSNEEMAWQEEEWRNSGFGLYITSRFCSERGQFRVISGDAGVTINENRMVEHDWRFDGTCVQMKISTKDLYDAEARILEIVAEGETLVGDGRAASKSSKSLGL